LKGPFLVVEFYAGLVGCPAQVHAEKVSGYDVLLVCFFEEVFEPGEENYSEYVTPERD